MGHQSVEWLRGLVHNAPDPANIEAGEREFTLGIWVAAVESALHVIFPSGHPIFARWSAKARERKNSRGETPATLNYDNLLAVAHAAVAVCDAGGLRGLVEGVQAETVLEVLGQAERLLGAGDHLAATCVAGGALETHLLHLCKRYSLSIPSPGSIEKYNGLLATHRNSGAASVVSVGDTKQVTAWGDLRNKADHEPLDFLSSRTKEQVRLMLDGVREFIARTS